MHDVILNLVIINAAIFFLCYMENSNLRTHTHVSNQLSYDQGYCDVFQYGLIIKMQRA